MNLLSILKIFKNKSYNYLNVIGLAVAFGVFIIVSIYIYREFQGDKFHENYENIVRLNRGDKVGTPIPLSDYYKDRFPEIENYCRLTRMYDPVIKNEDRFQKLKTGYFADKSAFDIFTFEIINGYISPDFSTPFSIGISENLSQKLFGSENPIGKVVKFNNEFDFIVKAVFKNLPSNSHLKIDAIGSIESMKFMNEIYKTPYENFTRWGCMNYLLLAPNSSVTQVNEKLNGLIQELMNDENFSFGIQPFDKIYFDSDSGMDECRHSSKQTLFILLTIVCIIMILACVNYINLSTAQIYTRHKEIGIKKISGATRFMLISQFIKESVLISFLAMIVGFGLAYLFQILISDLLPSDFNFKNVFAPKPLIFYTTLSVIIGIIAGLYPALYYSSAKELNILKGINSNAKNQGALRKGLIIVQFTASIVLIIGTLFVYKQLNFFKNTDPGFPKEQLMCVAYNEMALSPLTNSFVEEILKNPNIKSVTQTSTIPGNVFYQMVNRIENEDKILYDLVADNQYFETMGLNLIEGRMPSVNPEKRRNELVLNQTAVKYLGWKEPIGRTDIWGREVVGIVEDFNFMSMHQPIFPLMIRFDPFYVYATIKLNTQNTAQVLSDIESKWSEFLPAGIFEYRFFDDSFQQLYEAEIKFGQMAVYLSFIALFISLLGMAGVVSFITKRKIKEIGVRKVNGARISEILAMLNKDFIKWVAIAFVVACPIAYYAMHKWVENFAYKTTLSWWIFALAGLLALGIALLTVSFQSWKAAIRNPVESLRYE